MPAPQRSLALILSQIISASPIQKMKNLWNLIPVAGNNFCPLPRPLIVLIQIRKSKSAQRFSIEIFCKGQGQSIIASLIMMRDLDFRVAKHHMEERLAPHLALPHIFFHFVPFSDYLTLLPDILSRAGCVGFSHTHSTESRRDGWIIANSGCANARNESCFC